MAVTLPSRRSTNRKAFAESQLEQHLPKSAQTLVSSLSEDDREVLHYMLAFGLHLQMLAGVVVSSSNLQWKLWKAPSVKVGLKNEHSFVSLSSQSVPGKSRWRPQKAPLLFAHKPSASCDCFSCYSSFWSRWAASPNRDLLNTIIDIAEMADIGEEQKACIKGKEKKKKQEKKCMAAQETGGKKAKADNRKLQNTPKTPLISSVSVNMDEAMTAADVLNETSGCTSMDAMYDTLWDNVNVIVSKDETPHLAAQIRDGSGVLTENSKELNDTLIAKNGLLCGVEADALAKVSTMKITNSRPDMDSVLQISSWASSKQGEVSALAEPQGDGNSLNQACLSGQFIFAPMQGENNLKLQRFGKCKSSQIAPLFPEGTFVLAADDQDSSVSFEMGEMGDANLRGKGLLSCFLPNAVCGIAFRLWDLVSIGSRNRSVDYY